MPLDPTVLSPRIPEWIARDPARESVAILMGISVAAGGLMAISLASLALGSAELELQTVIGAFMAFDGSNGHLIVLERLLGAR